MNKYNKKAKIHALKKALLGISLGALSCAVFAQNTAPASTSTPAASAQKPAEPPKVPDFTGSTIEKIKAANKIVIGNRSSSIPISFYDANKKPVGYGVDICLGLVDKIKTAYNMPNIAVEFVEVSGDTRIPFLRQGKIDIECGSTTNNADRRKNVDFTIPYYVAGVRILVKNSSGIKSLNDLRGKKIALGKGTTSVKLMERFNKERAMNMQLLEENGFTAAFNAVAQGKADAFVLDDLLLFGERSKASNPQEFSVVGELLSVEPLAIMVRKNDADFKAFVDKYMVELITSGQINTVYKKWFESPIPPRNQALNIPQSPLLKDIFRMPTDVVGN